MPFTANNPHYGQHGDYPFSSRASGINSYKFGAYNRLDICMLDLLYLTGMIKRRRRELTFNPDFDFMAQEIRAFIG